MLIDVATGTLTHKQLTQFRLSDLVTVLNDQSTIGRPGSSHSVTRPGCPLACRSITRSRRRRCLRLTVVRRLGDPLVTGASDDPWEGPARSECPRWKERDVQCDRTENPRPGAGRSLHSLRCCSPPPPAVRHGAIDDLLPSRRCRWSGRHRLRRRRALDCEHGNGQCHATRPDDWRGGSTSHFRTGW